MVKKGSELVAYRVVQFVLVKIVDLAVYILSYVPNIHLAERERHRISSIHVLMLVYGLYEHMEAYGSIW